MKTPQMLMVVILALSAGINLALHGQPQTGKHNFGVSLVRTAIQVGLLVWGGFFA